MAKAPLRLRLAKAILGSRAKEFIPALTPLDDLSFGAAGRLNNFGTKREQLEANLGWCFAANNAIADPTAAVELKLYRKGKDGKREEIIEHELLDLLDAPNLAHTGEQLRHLHFTYMNFVGESYIYMRDLGGNEYIPTKGRLPAALEIFPAHLVQFKLESSYTTSMIKYAGNDYPLMAFIRDLNPDPAAPYFGRSIVKAAALTLDTENQMKQWNRGVFANSARPSLIFKSDQELSQEAYDRWKAQFKDENTGTDNAYKPLLIEGGDAKPYMMNQQDLDFLASRKFSMTEILSMWRVSPGMLGQLESANRSNLDAVFLINAIINVKPRIRQFVKQVNATLVKVYDPTLELDFADPVPEDIEAKLKAASAGVDKWWTKDEVREQYGDKELSDGLGAQLYMANNNAPLSAVADGSTKPQPAPPAPPPDTPPNGGAGNKAFQRKRQKKVGDVVCIMCNCCDAAGEHDTGFECYRCDASGWCTPSEDEAPIPCAGRKDSPEVWVDDDGYDRHAEEKSLSRGKKKDLTPEEIAAQRARQGEAKKTKYDAAAAGFEQRMVTVMAQQFDHQRDEILAHLDTTRIGKSYGRKVKGKQPTYTRKDWLQDLLDWAEAAGSFKAAIQPLIHTTLMQAGQDAIQEVGFDPSQFDPFTPAIVEYFQNRSMKIAKDVGDETEKQLRASLSQGVLAGESTYELRARVEDVMGSASTMRADRIARTEVSRAQGYGDIQAWTQSGVVEGKEWICAADERTCPFCLSLDKQVWALNENIFNKGDSMTVDGQTQHYNYDDVPSQPLHAQCRCSLLPVRVMS